jgi:serine/threonine-protein kinase PknK
VVRRRNDDAEAEAALLPVAVECERNGLIRFLLDGGPDVVAAVTRLHVRAAETNGHSGHRDIPRAFLEIVLNATG